MKKFKFKLEKLLYLREHREREAEIELGHAIGELNRIENEIKNVAAKRLEAAALRFKTAVPGDSDAYRPVGV